MIAGILGFALRHWKGTGMALVLAAALAWGGWQHVRATAAVGQRDKARAALVALQSAEKAADAKAHAEQAAADAENARERAALAAQAASAIRALAVYRQTASAKQASLQAALQGAYANHPEAQAWRDTPVPASVLAAITGAARE